MKDKKLTYQQAQEFLRRSGVHGSDKNLESIVHACGQEPSTLEAVATALCDLKDGDASKLDCPEVLEAILKTLVHSGKAKSALELYHQDRFFPKAGGGYKTLGRKRGQFAQGLKLTSVFREAAEAFQGIGQEACPETGFPSVAHDRALFLIELGELTAAEAILRSPIVGQAEGPYPGIDGKCLRQLPARLNLCDILILTGRLSEAFSIADMMVRASESEDICDPRGGTLADRFHARVSIGEYVGGYRFTTGFNPYAHRAVVRALQGQIEEALLDFKQAEGFQQKKLSQLYERRTLFSQIWHSRYMDQEASIDLTDEAEATSPPPLIGLAAVHYGLLLTRLGMLHSAQKVLDYNRRWAAHPFNRFPGMVALAGVALSDVYRLMGNEVSASRQLEYPLAWSAETGQKEIACWSHLSLARLHLLGHRLDEAQVALDKALDLAETHNFVLYEIDCRVTGGRIAFLNQDWGRAKESASTALYAAADPECSYAWGQGSALHLLAEIEAHPSCGARRYYREEIGLLARGAVKIRERIRDPRLANSQELLAKVA